ncbi:MAG TPA: hypothetical protein VMS76_07690 [Planctomycetota bacterium]|nr:hypothetical protein [Planctomycetota bacterium]
MNSMRQFLSRGLALACLLATATAATFQGAPTLLPGDTAIGPAGGVQQFPAISAGPGVHLVAWADHRSAFETLTTGVGTRDVYAMRVDAAGNSLTPLPLRVAGGPGRKKDVRVAWNGTHWLVTWQNELPTTFSKAPGLLGARVDAQGNLVDDPPLLIRKYTNSKAFAYDVSSDGNDWVVAIQGSSAGEADVEGWRVTSGGVVSMASSALFPTTQLLLGFDLAWNGSQYLLTWSNSGVSGRRYDAALAPLGGEIFIASSGANEGAIAAVPGGGFLVAWSMDFNGYSIEYRTVSATGGLGPIVQASGSVTYGFDPSVAWNGNGFTLAWTSGLFPPTTLRYARISAAGALLDPGGLPHGQGAAPSFQVISSLGDGNAQLAWIDKPTTPPHVGDVFGTRLTPSGPDPAVALSTSVPRQGSPDVAAGGPGYLAVFTSERAGAVSILAQRLNPLGTAIDLQPVELGAGTGLGHPRVAWNGSSFLVVWQDEIDPSFPTDDIVLARRVGADGSLLDPAPFQVMQGATPDVGAASGTFLVAARYALTTQLWYTHAVRVDGAGVVLDPAPLVVGGNFARFPSVGSFGDRWVIAWQRNPTHDNPAASARSRVVLPSGAMLSDVSIGGGSTPSVAASSAVALVVWRSSGGLWGQRMDRDGNLLGSGAPVASSSFAMTNPSVGWDGSEFVLAWEDLRNQTAFFDDRRDIFASRVAEDGTVLSGPSGFPLAASVEDEQQPAVAGSGGAHLFALASFLPHAPHAAVRTAVVHVGSGCSGVAACYCTAKVTSSGCVPSIGSFGLPSASAGSGFLITASQVEPNKFGLLFYGKTGQLAVPFQGGTLCVNSPQTRTSIQDSGGAATCSGTYSIDFNAYIATGSDPALVAGQQVNGQYWFRDPGFAPPNNTGLSNAIEFTIDP